MPIIRSWALTRGFALHPETRNRYEIRYTRTQHRPPIAAGQRPRPSFRHPQGSMPRFLHQSCRNTWWMSVDGGRFVGIARSRRHQQPAPGTMSGSARTSFLTRRPRPRPVGTPTASMHRAMPRRGRPRNQNATSRRARSRGYRPLKSAGPLDRLWFVSAYGDIKTSHTALTRIPKVRRGVDSMRA